MKKLVALLVALALVLCVFTACAKQEAAPVDGGAAAATAAPAAEKTEDKYFTFAASPATAAMYPYWVAVAQAVQAAYPEMHVSVSESQGATDVSNRIRAGEADVGNSASPSDYDNFNGLKSFDGNPNKDARMLWYYDTRTACLIAVSEESGITTIEGLTGQKVNPGGTGTTAAKIAMDAMKLLGVEPNWFESGKADAADAYANRQIVGVGASAMQPDSYVVQLQASRPVRILSYTDEQLAKILEAMPYLMPMTISANTYEGIDYDVQVYSFMQGAQSSKNLSQEDGYKMVKAVFETQRSIWEEAMPNLAGADLVANSLSSAIPLHAGTVQYLVEKGVEVPADLIPAEYVPVG